MNYHIIPQNSNFFYFISDCSLIYYCQGPALPPMTQEGRDIHQNQQQNVQGQESLNNDQIKNYEKIVLTNEDLMQAGYEQKKKPWNEEQDANLIRLINKNLKWNKIAKLMNGRSTKMCYSRYKRIIAHQNNSQRARFWSKQEDEKLVNLVETYGQNWRQVCTFFQDRKPKQLRQRYINALMPNISKQPWTFEQDLKLIQLYNTLGKRWKTIALQLSNRSENQVKNRFYGRILPLQNKKQEDSIKIQQYSQ